MAEDSAVLLAAGDLEAVDRVSVEEGLAEAAASQRNVSNHLFEGAFFELYFVSCSFQRRSRKWRRH